MIARPRGSVTIPRVPRGLGNIIKWSREVNQCLQQLRDRVVVTKASRSGKAGAASSNCSFGEIYTNEEEPPVTAIRGGAFICGDQNFAVADQPLTLETDGKWLVEISLTGVTAATDDDGELFIPGVITATGTPAWANNAYTGTENYTETTNPASPASPTGTIIIPIGVLTIADGAATLSPTGCGTIRVNQCAGLLTHTRGG